MVVHNLSVVSVILNMMLLDTSHVYASSLSLLRVTAYMLQCLYAMAILSVCPSVRPSHGWISQKRLKLGSRSFHHTVAPSL